MSFIDFFPTELIEVLFSYLSVQDLVNLSMVCVSWYEASNMSSVWRAAIKRSNPKDRFRILSNLDRFTGIASNFDDNHCFQVRVDRQSPSNLSPMNTWKLSVCQNNFVRNNWHRSHNSILARHEIKFESNMEIEDFMKVVYPSKSPQDRLYLPILAKKIDQHEKDFFLIRLDGKPRISQKLLSTESNIPIICIDRDCVVWVQDREVKYLSIAENKDSSRIEILGTLLIAESHFADCQINRFWNYFMTMDDKYIVAGFKTSSVKIWCKKTKQLKLTHETNQTISNINCVLTFCYLYNEHIYFNYGYSSFERSFLEIYDIKKDKFLENPSSSLTIENISFSDKYYAMYLHGFTNKFVNLIIVCEIKSNEVKISLNVNDPNFHGPLKVWIVDDKVLYIEQRELKILSLFDWTIRHGMHVSVKENFGCIYDIWDSFLLAKERNKLTVWDWKLERKLHELLLDISPDPEQVIHFHNDETRLVAVSKKSVNIIGFW